MQGLADLYALLRLPFDSDEAQKLNVDIFEAIYVGALEASIELAKKHGPHDSYAGSPASRGELQPDLWGLNAKELDAKSRWDWAQLRADLARYGLRNSLLTAPMPTASTAQIMGCNECFEPYTSNLYARRVKARSSWWRTGLVKDLCELGLWDENLRRDLLRAQGWSRAGYLTTTLYKTAWELSQKSLLDLSAGRGPFVDQSQSLNCFIAAPDYGKLTTFHFRGWEAGLKTGMYYLRTRPAADAIQFTLEASAPGAAAAAAPATIDDGRGGPRRAWRVVLRAAGVVFPPPPPPALWCSISMDEPYYNTLSGGAGPALEPRAAPVGGVPRLLRGRRGGVGRRGTGRPRRGRGRPPRGPPARRGRRRPGSRARATASGTTSRSI